MTEKVAHVTTSVSLAAFDLECVKKAAYRFADRVSLDLHVEGTAARCTLVFHEPASAEAAASLLSAFRTELLDQDLRKSIASETAPIRNAILAYAFSRTGLQDE